MAVLAWRRHKAHCRLRQQTYARVAVDSLISEHKHNPRAFWSGLSDKPGSLPAPGYPEGCTSFFQGIFNTRPPDAAPTVPIGDRHDDSDCELNQPISENEVSVALDRLRAGCSAGSDGVPGEFFKCAVRRDAGGSVVQQYLLAPFLAKLFDHCFQHGTSPDDWGQAVMTLIHEGGEATDWGNYRPIAVVQVICKLYAGVLSKRLHGWA